MNRLYGPIVAIALGSLFSGGVAAAGRGDSFDWVWQTVHDKFYDAKFNGVDWNAMKSKYRDRASRAGTREEHAAVINEMLAELRTSHTVFYTPDTLQYFQLLGLFLPQNDWLGKATARTLTNGKALYSGIGIFTETLNGQHFVRGVHEGLPAHKAGIQVGDRLISVDGAPFHAIRSFEGKAGKPVTIVVEETPGVTRTVTVTPVMLDGSTMFVDAMTASVQIVHMDDGTRLEGKGVEPDIEVPFDLPYSQGRDPRKARAVDDAARLVKAEAG